MHNFKSYSDMLEQTVPIDYGSGQHQLILKADALKVIDQCDAEMRHLKDALADAIRRPMGITPASAEPFITHQDLVRAEARRTSK